MEEIKPLTKGEKFRIYLLSFLLSPLGLWWVFKFIKHQDPERRKVAYIVLVITAITLTSAIWVSSAYYKLLTRYIDMYRSYGLIE